MTKNNFVFYLETQGPTSGSQRLLLDMAAYLADHSDKNVYYVNNYFNEDIMQQSSEKLIISTPQEFDFSISNDAVFLCPVNYLMHLFVRIKDYPEAKICLYQYHAQVVDWLCNNLGKMSAKNEILEFLNNTSCRAFLNYDCVTPVDSLRRYEDRLFFPLAQPGDVMEFSAIDLISKDTINLGYLGNLNARSYTFLYNLFNNLSKMKLKTPINIHIIGNANIALNASFKQCSNNMTRIIFTDTLEEEDCKNYIKNNLDLIFATNENAIKAASYGVPVVVPVMGDKPFIGNNYVYIYDINGYIYSFNNAALFALDNTCHKLNKIINDLYTNGQKQIIAKRCYDYYYENNSMYAITRNFCLLAEQSELYVRDCLCEPNIQNCLDKYLEYAQDNEVEGFSDYLAKKATQKKVERPDPPVAPQPIKADKKKIKAFFTKVVKKVILAEDKKFYDVQNHYKIVQNRLHRKFVKEGKLKVAFLLVFESVFPTRPVFEKMLKDRAFDPYIVVAPNISKTMSYQIETSTQAINSLSKLYPGRVINAYDATNDIYHDFSNEFDIVFFCNPYDSLVHPNHHITHFIKKNALTLYSSYGFAALKFWEEVIGLDFYNYLWKACVETPSNLKYLQKVEKIKGKNGVVTGYIKVDELASLSPTPRERKRILICPHHTVWGWKNLNIGNFLKYSELFIRLPKMFSDIDFVFRPHPLLLTNLRDHNVWTQTQIDDFFKRLLANPNMTYDTSGDYFQQFVDSDAMIHDCGSFIGEYLYTEKPCCYMMKSKEETYAGLVPLGQQCMDQYYHAFEEKDIIQFINEVVLKGNDPLKNQRESFVQTELKSNFPNAAQKTIQIIKDALRIKE